MDMAWTVATGVSMWEIVTTVGALVLLLGAILAVQVWSRRRRNRGEEASTADGEGAEAILRLPDH